MSQLENKKIAFNIVIDKQRARFILMLLKAAEKNPETHDMILSTCEYLKLDPLEDFINEFIKKCKEINIDKDEEFIKLTSIKI